MFGVFGDGQYRLQPILVDDLASLASLAVQSGIWVSHEEPS